MKRDQNPGAGLYAYKLALPIAALLWVLLIVGVTLLTPRSTARNVPAQVTREAPK